MEEKNKKKQIKSIDATQYICDGTEANLIVSTRAKLKEDINAVDNFSAGLGVSMLSPFVTDYQSTLATQAGTRELFNGLGNSLIVTRAIGASASVSNVIADIGLTTVNAHKLYRLGTINETQLGTSVKMSDTLLDIVSGQQIAVRTGVLDAISTTAKTHISNELPFLSTTRMVNNGVDSMLRALPTYPTEVNFPSLYEVREASRVEEKEIFEHQKKLDEYLKKIDPELVVYRQGAWETFNKKGKDYFGQSTSSMRRVVDTLIHILAPDEEVKKTEYFKLGEGNNKGRPTRKARLRYIVKFEIQRSEHLERLTNGIDSLLEVYQNLPAWDHAPLKKDEFVYGTFVATEGHLISLLSEI